MKLIHIDNRRYNKVIGEVIKTLRANGLLCFSHYEYQYTTERRREPVKETRATVKHKLANSMICLPELHDLSSCEPADKGHLITRYVFCLLPSVISLSSPHSYSNLY